MLDDKEMVSVTNRDNGRVGYTIPDLNNLHRDFESGETKKISMEELRKLSYILGGRVLLEEYLVIQNAEAVKELLGNVEPEYNYSEAEITRILTKGSLDELLDTLDFGPQGVKELVKGLAVKLEINDIAKRDAILEKTGFNVTKAIEINKETTENEKTTTTTRRTTPVVNTQKTETTRRTDPPKYTITSIK